MIELKKKLNYDFYKKQEKKYKEYVEFIASIRMIVFIGLIVSFIGKYYYLPKVLTGLFIFFLISFIILVIVHDYFYKKYNYYSKYVTILDTYLARDNGTWKNFSDNGLDLLSNQSSYLKDLDILGDCSLFQYLTICKTIGGRERLLKKLSNQKLTSTKLKLDQEMIEELVNKCNFVVDFQVALSFYEKKDINLSKDFSCLEKDINSRTIDLFIGIICSLLCIIFLILGFFHIIRFQYFYAMFLFNFILSFLYSLIFQKEFETITHAIHSFSGMQTIMSRITCETFTSKKMNEIQKDIEAGKESISRLGKIDTLNSLKNNFLSNFILNGFFCINLLLLHQFCMLLSNNFTKIKKSIDAIEELEAMISLANLGIVKNEKCMPVMCEEVKISFEAIKHPLLEEKECVENDFSTLAGVQIITGSNMGGKTSFLRTVGINIILMNAGSYVCAKSFQASYFKIFTSMRIEDDLGKCISTFYGELLRIKEAISYIDKGNMLVLIDEIFKGTNYQDRMYGAKEVIKRLNTKMTVTFITTHDFELCDEANVINYHVKEYYEGNHIFFDYKIRNGKSTSTNAKYLMKKLGIIE